MLIEEALNHLSPKIFGLTNMLMFMMVSAASTHELAWNNLITSVYLLRIIYFIEGSYTGDSW